MYLLSRDLGTLCDLHVITHQSHDDYELLNCSVHYIPNKFLPWDSSKSQFLKLLDDIKPDIFHTNACWDPLTALTSIWAKKAGYKVVYTPHGELTPYSLSRHYWTKKLPAIMLYQKKGVRMADVIHVTCEKEREELLKLGWNYKMQVISNCVQIDKISIKDTWIRRKKIIFISRIHHKKGVHFLINAVCALKKELEDYKVYIVGEREDVYYDEMIMLSKKLGVSDIVEFTGPVYGEKKWEMYRKSDVFVLPTYNENFGIVVPEALACGTPAITTIGAPWEDLVTHKCGWWIEQGTSPLVEAIKDFLSKSDKELKEMGLRGRNLVIEKYSSESIAHQFTKMYDKLISEK